jgi:feruloyl esterase
LNLAIHGSSMEHMVFDPPRPGYDWRSFDFARDPALLAELSALIDATDPDLDVLRDRGGKVLMYHGTADPALVVGMSAGYRDAVADRYGEAASEFYRLYAMPGMFHCRGGFGPDRVDYLEAIVQWVEAGREPDLVARQVGADGAVVRSRPLCEYPAYARYAGGDPDAATSFECATP